MYRERYNLPPRHPDIERLTDAEIIADNRRWLRRRGLIDAKGDIQLPPQWEKRDLSYYLDSDDPYGDLAGDEDDEEEEDDEESATLSDDVADAMMRSGIWRMNAAERAEVLKKAKGMQQDEILSMFE